MTFWTVCEQREFQKEQQVEEEECMWISKIMGVRNLVPPASRRRGLSHKERKTRRRDAGANRSVRFLSPRTNQNSIRSTLLLPLDHPLAMRIPTRHILGQLEREIRIHAFDSPIAPI